MSAPTERDVGVLALQEGAPVGFGFAVRDDDERWGSMQAGAGGTAQRRTDVAHAASGKTKRLREKMEALREQMRRVDSIREELTH